MIHDPKVSVVIPTYNRKHIVLDAIQSALSQSIQDHEIIVVDDGSTDGTAEYLKSLGLPIRIVEKQNGGVASARNAGIKAAQGSYIAFLDSDDAWLPEKLQAQLEYLALHPSVPLVYADEYIEENGVILPKTRFKRSDATENEKDNFLLSGFIQRTPIHTSTVMVLKSVLDEVGYFNETLKIHEDSELWNRISMKYPFGFIDRPLATFRYAKDPNHLMKDSHSASSIEEDRKYLKLYEDMHRDTMTKEIEESIRQSYELLEGWSRESAIL